MTLLALALFAIVVVVGGYALLCLRRDGWRSILGPCLVLFVSVTSLGLAYLSLGRPMPWTIQATPLAYPLDVVGYVLVEDEAIYLYLRVPEDDEPFSLALPWDLGDAQQLVSAAAQAWEWGTPLQMMGPVFESGLDDQEPMFHALPQPALPDKEPQ